MAYVVKSTVTEYARGSESYLDQARGLVLVIAVVAAVASLIVSGMVTKDSEYDDWAEEGLSPTWVAVGVGAFIQGWIVSVLLRAGADIVRLLKKQNGLEFSGDINRMLQSDVYSCSECGESFNESYFGECPRCKSKLDVFRCSSCGELLYGPDFCVCPRCKSKLDSDGS
ncbi:MAG: hypothetical protein IT585_02080 [candidate division Zixibacteria bacterium]|nr:hypothetical protein [candidate division Zixibacteria bacterium]